MNRFLISAVVLLAAVAASVEANKEGWEGYGAPGDYYDINAKYGGGHSSYGGAEQLYPGSHLASGLGNLPPMGAGYGSHGGHGGHGAHGGLYGGYDNFQPAGNLYGGHGGHHQHGGHQLGGEFGHSGYSHHGAGHHGAGGSTKQAKAVLKNLGRNILNSNPELQRKVYNIKNNPTVQRGIEKVKPYLKEGTKLAKEKLAKTVNEQNLKQGYQAAAANNHHGMHSEHLY